MLLLGLVDVPVWLILILVIVVALYWGTTWNHNYLKELGVPHMKPVPLFGVNKEIRDADLYTADAKYMKILGKVHGFFLGNTPELIVGDHDMITEIAIKQFHKFADRRDQIIKDAFFHDSLFSQKGEKWKSTRTKMSPTFTTGKLKAMASEINRSAKSLSEKLKSMKEPFEAKYTAFGLRLDSQNDDNSDFNKHGRKFIDFNIRSLKVAFLVFAPKWMVSVALKLGVDLNFFDEASGQFFMNVFDQTLQGRTASGKRNDFLQLMIKAQQGESIHDQEDGMQHSHTDNTGLTKGEILANALLFFLAGFDTVSLGLTNLIYSLACNQPCQDKVIEEVEAIVGNEEDVTYEMVTKLHYLDQCINEALRIYPPVMRVDRQAMCDTEVCGWKIKKGLTLNIPILAIHRDPDIWPEPMKFDPDRFSPENKPNIKQTHWMPFGIGPRNCIGMRQALFELKVAVVEVLKTHRFITCDKTEIPLKMSQEKMMRAENGVWLALEERS